MIQLALQSRPEIHVARAQVAGTCAAVKLAKGDRIPTPIIGPQFEKDETGTLFYGFVFIAPIPILNSGTPMVRLREAEQILERIGHAETTLGRQVRSRVQEQRWEVPPARRPGWRP